MSGLIPLISFLPSDARECRKWASMRCSQCGANNRETARFCDSCGTAIHTEPSAVKKRSGRPSITGERRHLTVLFCDLVGSTEIAARLDPEEWREILASYHHAVTEAVSRFGGYVAQYFGDGVMAYFGWPAAHDNNAERAVRAGLAIIDAVMKLNEHAARAKLSARIGIDSGAVVVGTGIDSRADVFGDTPNIAARVQSKALPNTVLITADTNQLISGLFVVGDSGKHTLKGFDQPVQLYRVIRPSDAQGRLQASAETRGLTSFVGRDDELRHLMNCWECALQGEPQSVLISGEGGIGKSRLVHHFHQQIAGRAYNWVEGMASSFFQNTPFYPIVAILRELQNHRHKVADLATGTGLQRGGKRTVPPGTIGNGHSGNGALSGTKEHHERLAPPQGLEFTPDLAAATVALNLSAGAEPTTAALLSRQRLLATLVEWVVSAAQLAPLVFVIEDLHWADPSTLELLQLLAERAAPVPLMLLCTARPEFRVKWPPHTHQTQVTLRPLNAHYTRKMVLDVADDKTLSEHTLAIVVQRTAGVPLFIEELTRAVLESDNAEDAGWRIPATLHDSLMARLDRLGPARETLKLAAVLGIEFTYELLLAVTPLTERELQRDLAELAEAELLYAHGLSPDVNYQFKHALIRDVAYEALLRSRRREFHQRIAQIIEDRFPAQAALHPEMLAYHYTEAGLISQSIRYWRKAGQSASERSANIEAITQLRRGIELIKALPPASERLMEEIKLQIALTTPLAATRGYLDPEVEHACNRALELSREVGETPQLFSVLGALNSIYFNRGELEVALELGRRMLHVAGTQRDQVLMLWAHYSLGFTFASQGILKLARDHLEKSIALYDPRKGGTYGFVQDPGPTAMVLLAHVIYKLGYPDQALERVRQAVALVRSLSHHFTTAWVLGFAGELYWRRGNKVAAQELWSEMAALSNEQGFKLMIAKASVFLGFALADQGRADDGLSKMHEGLYGIIDALPMDEKVHGSGFFALALGKAGRVDEGLSKIDEALRLAKQAKTFGDVYLLQLIKGHLLLMKNAAGLRKAKQCFSTALDLARKQRAKSDELRAGIPFAKLLILQGRRDQAHSMLKKIYNWFTEGFDTADLKQAKALLDELKETPRTNDG